MRKQASRRALIFAASATAGVLVLASAAFACGTWRGRIVIQGDASTAQSEATGRGPGFGMDYCPGATNTSGAQISGVGGSFQIWAYSATCGTGTSQLLAGPYTINYMPKDLRTTAAFDDCMNGLEGGAPTGGVGIPLTTVDVNSSGQIVGQPVTVDAGPALAESSPGVSLICISGAVPLVNSGSNMQVQVQFV